MAYLSGDVTRPLRCPWCQEATDAPYTPNGITRCINCDRTFTAHQEARYLLHVLWSKARADPETYVKAEWMQLQGLTELQA